jgi:glycosyltransferase involved in cell wall biosynthesis
MKVLALADNCNPEWPSLPIVGYQYAKALAEYVDLTVVTQIRNRPNIEKVGLGRANVVYLDTERVAAPIYKLATFLRGGGAKGWTLQMAMDYPSYIAFERAAFRHFKRALASDQFQIVHRITPMSPTLPSPLASWSDVPFVLGPLNGGLIWPAAFTREQRREREWLSRVRYAYRLLPYYRSTYVRPRAILAAFDHTIDDLPDSAKSRAINFPEVGIHPALFSRPIRSRRDRITVLCAGRLVPYKLPDVVVRAFAASPLLRKHRLLIVGDGPERPLIEQVIAEHKLADSVQLVGQQPQSKVAEYMRESEIFAFPSIRELGAGVVVEAMACGMACVAVDYGAPATLIDADRGLKVPLGAKQELVERFQLALESLVANPERIEQLGAAAHRHAMEFYDWDVKARKTIEVYDWVLGSSTTKPDFWSPKGVDQHSDQAIG